MQFTDFRTGELSAEVNLMHAFGFDLPNSRVYFC